MPETLRYWLPVAAVLAVFAERMREVFTRRETLPGRRLESRTFVLFMVCGLLIVIGGVVEYLVRGRLVSWATFVPGVIISVASFLVRRAAIRALGRFWSLHVEMREGHVFVRSGPFAYARHPVYFSMILELLGIALMANAWITLAVVLAIFIPTLLLRLRLEERALVAQFGDVYRDYMRVMPAIVPGLGGRRQK